MHDVLRRVLARCASVIVERKFTTLWMKIQNIMAGAGVVLATPAPEQSAKPVSHHQLLCDSIRNVASSPQPVFCIATHIQYRFF